MSDNMSYLYTAGGYVALIIAGYIAYHVSTQKAAKKRVGANQAKTTKSADAETRKEDRKKKQRKENFSSEAQEASRKAAQTKSTAETQNTWADVAAHGKDDKDDNVDNKEFAKQLAKAQEGHKLSSKTEGSKKQSQKSVKQSRANQMQKSNFLPVNATPSDGDDDQSPIASPDTRAADASGVADMLDPAPAAPSVLRLTNTEEKPQQKFTKAPEKTETKKQRQNRKKAEAAKAFREDAEKERRALEEKQRRQARIAEGRPAKDGSQFVKANGNNSAWSKGPANGDKPADDSVFQPLDTFESTTPASVPAPAPAKQGKPATTRGDDWASSLPSEEEQMELLKAEADEWNTVKTKSKKNSKKTTSGNESVDENITPSASRTTGSSNQDSRKPGKLAPKPVKKQNFGAFSALTAKDDPAEEDEEAEEREEEWEV